MEVDSDPASTCSSNKRIAEHVTELENDSKKVKASFPSNLADAATPAHAFNPPPVKAEESKEFAYSAEQHSNPGQHSYNNIGGSKATSKKAPDEVTQPTEIPLTLEDLKNNIKLVYSCDEQSKILPCQLTIAISGREMDPATDTPGHVGTGKEVDDDEKASITSSVLSMFSSFDTPSNLSISKLECDFMKQEFRTEDALIVNVKVTSSVHSGEDLFDILEKKENAFETKLKALLADKNLTCTSVVLGRGLIPRMAKNSVQYCNIARYLNIDIGEDGIPEWPGDWGGNLHLFREDIKIDKIKKPFHEHFQQDWKKLMHFFSHVTHLTDTPPRAKLILSHSAMRPTTNALQKFNFMFDAANYCNYNPLVLQQDGWTIAPTDPSNPTVKDNHIGKSVWWLNAEAVIIAYVHDDGEDFWRAKYVNDYETADLDSEEIVKALKAFEVKRKRLNKPKLGLGERELPGGKSTRHGDPSFVVDNIDSGVIMAVSLNTTARNNVLWPARVMHASESNTFGERKLKKQINHHHINVVFFAPYWIEVNDGSSTSVPLFEYEAITCDPKYIRKYPFEGKTLDFEALRTAFSFTGLPNKAFTMFVDAHRLAMGFKNFADTEKEFIVMEQKKFADLALQQAGNHVMSVKAPLFPMALLNLPWIYVLKQLKKPTKEPAVGFEKEVEPILNLMAMLNALSPPNSHSTSNNQNNSNKNSPPQDSSIKPLIASSSSSTKSSTNDSNSPSPSPLNLTITDFCGEYLAATFQGDISILIKTHLESSLASITASTNPTPTPANCKTPPTDPPEYVCPKEIVQLGVKFSQLLAELEEDVLHKYLAEDAHVLTMLKSNLNNVLQMKKVGEDALTSIYRDSSPEDLMPFVMDWRKTCENLFSYVRCQLTTTTAGAGIAAVLSDARCGNHYTGTQSYERSVRLSAALKGAKLAGAGTNDQHVLIPAVEEEDMQLARKVINFVHDKKYIKRIEHKVSVLSDDAKGEALTDDSDGEGGDDTGGSKGSWDAAICGVACAVKGVKMVVSGQASNAFCATRPPGHHAGRDLRAMGAPSNGFCLLNTAAAAAKFAVLPVQQGGAGLRRVCVIDFDVHHGNGTQETLCSTYDPRFLYISMHAGGVETDQNNDEDFDDMDDGHNSRSRSRDAKASRGIFPGDCGDTSPHPGVVNIPLGWKVTPEAFGMELMGTVKSAVTAFCPDLIVLSAGFDAHKNDPLGLGGLSSLDFNNITSQCCAFAENFCSGRVVSILEGGYGVPCCAFTKRDLFLPKNQLGHLEAYTDLSGSVTSNGKKIIDVSEETRKKISYMHDSDSLGYDEMSPDLAKQLMKCTEEGFVECVAMHCFALKKSSKKTGKHPLMKNLGK